MVNQAPPAAPVYPEGEARLLAKLSQEIRTPMHEIINLADQLLVADLSGGQHAGTMAIKRASNAMLALINDVNDFARLTAGQLELTASWFSMSELLENLCAIFRLMAMGKGVSFQSVLDPAMPQVFRGDSYRLRQIFNSLLGNVLSMTQSGGIRLETGWDGSGVSFTVQSGTPAEGEDTATLFDPLVQIDAHKHGGAGSGLSLLISRSLCQLMGGTMRVERGAHQLELFARLPLVPGTGPDLQAQLSRPTRFTTRDVRALVVDDIDINLFITRHLLESFGIQASTATGGREALEQVAADSFDIIFMDHMMPNMDGVETTQHIRQIPGRQSQTPIIALTANAIVGAREMFLHHGLDDYLAKPIDAEDMAVCLLKWLPGHKLVNQEEA